jgi:6-phosphogluconolactonase (cycloisomerase 2 family)
MVTKSNTMWRQGAVALGLTACLVSAGYATGVLFLRNAHPLAGAGDTVCSIRRQRAFVYASEFVNGQAGKVHTYEYDPAGNLTHVGDTPAGREPRAIAMARNGDYAVVVNSIDDELTVMSVGDNGILRPAGRAPSGGDNPFDVAGAFNDLVVVANRDSDFIEVFSVNRRGELIARGGAGTGGLPHVVVVSRRGLIPVPGTGGRSMAAGEERVVLVAVANQTGQSISLFRMNKEGALTDLGDIPLGKAPRALSWLDNRLFVALDEPGAPLPGTPEDFIRSFEIGFDGTVRQGPDTPAGYFLTDIEATKKGLFAVTVNLNGADPDRDEVRVYKIDDLSLTLDAAIQPNGASPSFKQIATAPADRPLDRRVVVTEFQGGFIRSLTYDRNP